MRYSRYFSVLCFLLLSGCLGDAQQKLQSCTAAAAVRYPAGSTPPLGQPYTDIIGCMHMQGYDVSSIKKECQRDYTSIAADAACYRPANFFTGYAYEIGSEIR